MEDEAGGHEPGEDIVDRNGAAPHSLSQVMVKPTDMAKNARTSSNTTASSMTILLDFRMHVEQCTAPRLRRG
jgi:hypothetical protein